MTQTLWPIDIDAISDADLITHVRSGALVLTMVLDAGQILGRQPFVRTSSVPAQPPPGRTANAVPAICPHRNYHHPHHQRHHRRRVEPPSQSQHHDCASAVHLPKHIATRSQPRPWPANGDQHGTLDAAAAGLVSLRAPETPG